MINCEDIRKHKKSCFVCKHLEQPQSLTYGITHYEVKCPHQQGLYMHFLKIKEYSCHKFEHQEYESCLKLREDVRGYLKWIENVIEYLETGGKE